MAFYTPIKPGPAPLWANEVAAKQIGDGEVNSVIAAGIFKLLNKGIGDLLPIELDDDAAATVAALVFFADEQHEVKP